MRLLIANRGEIAVRVARTAHEMGHSTVAIFSEADAGALHVRVATDSVPVGPSEPAGSYLAIDRILDAARRTASTAIHPGYGFLSENPAFAQAVIDAGLMWVGPSPDVMRVMGDKVRAREAAVAVEVPVLPGATSVSPANVAALGFPVLIKAAGGGGGRGMRVVAEAGALAEALVSAAAEAQAAFGNPTLYAERYLARPRHVEVQVMGDRDGTVHILGDRECSIQRRHQKLIEEAPCAVLSAATRQALHDAAARLATSVGYRGAGTLEFLFEGGEFYFLEMNTRLQVEHPVTEMRFGRDLVRDQLLVAMGESIAPVEPPVGHAIECRIIAEDPAKGFLPGPGRIGMVRWPSGPGIRVDAGVAEGDDVSMHYDPLLAKVIVHAPDRPSAIARMGRALAETVVLGVPTTVEFLGEVIAHPAFAAGELDTGFLGRHFSDWQPPAVHLEAFVAAWVGGRSEVRPGTAAALPTPWATLGGWGNSR